MAARPSLSNSPENNEDGEQRREIRRKYRDLIQDLQGMETIHAFALVSTAYSSLSRNFATATFWNSSG